MAKLISEKAKSFLSYLKTELVTSSKYNVEILSLKWQKKTSLMFKSTEAKISTINFGKSAPLFHNSDCKLSR